MPIHESWGKLISSLNSTYCKGSSEGGSAPFKCKKSQSVFYAMINKRKLDEKKPMPKHMTEDDINEFLCESCMLDSKDLINTDTDLLDSENQMTDDMAKLSYKARQKLSSASFCDPENRRYPAHDPAHIRNGIARIRQHPNDPKYGSILRCLIGRAKRAGIKVSEDVQKSTHSEVYPATDFALVRENGDKFLQFRENGILVADMLLDCLKTVDYLDELTDGEWETSKILLMKVAEEYVKVMIGEKK